MKNLIFIFAIAFFSLFYSCKEESGMLYDLEQKDLIYFQLDDGYEHDNNGTILSRRYADTLNVSLSALSPTTTFVDRDAMLKLMGNVVDYDRKINIEIDAELSTVIVGTDVEIDIENVVLPAGKSQVYLPVRIHRTERMITETLYLVLKVLPNENFDVLEEYRRTNNLTSGDILSGTTFRFNISDVATKTSYWDWFGASSYGEWEIVKYNTLNSLMGWSHYDWVENWNDPGAPSYAKIPYSARILQTYLQEMADAGTPVIDSNGEYVQLTGNYTVDYSAYENI